jgi:hypothetical protein
MPVVDEIAALKGLLSGWGNIVLIYFFGFLPVTPFGVVMNIL